MKGILALASVPCSVDELWVADFLCHFMLDRQRTLYAAIHKLEPAHTLVVDHNGTRRRRYWAMDPERELAPARDEEYVEAFREKLLLAVRRRLRSVSEV